MRKTASSGGLVYSTEAGRMCPVCRQPIASCSCAAARTRATTAGDGIARIRRETGGRGGKTVTTVTGLALDEPALVALSKRLKAACGTGVEMLGPPAAFLLLHGVEANFLSPMIMGHRLRLRPVFVFLSVMVWGWLWGIAGAFLAVPLLLALRAFCKRTRNLRVVCVYLEGD